MYSTKPIGLALPKLIAVSVAFILVGLMAGTASAREEDAGNRKELQGISFDEFWQRLSEQGGKWAGDKLYVRKVSSGTAGGFDRHAGLSPLWEAQIVKCTDLKEQRTSENSIPLCKGKAMIVRMAERGLAGMEEGIHMRKEGIFRGNAISFDRIKLSAAAAEEIANTYKHYRPIGFESYAYELNIDHSSNRPVWIIKKACSLRGIVERRCKSKDHWIVRIDAETSGIMK
ncbi:MAG TPA: hypothetical protein VMT62_01185 [Syntrophorhabdaceae bacterium]|nr:hypothetical protein [Syntrophorhabdaceae bacterium]